MSSIDDEIVTLKFNNKQFEAGVSTSLATLDKLKKSLDFSASQKSMDDLQASTSKFNLGNIGASIEGASSKFLTLATVGITALTNITNKAITAGQQIVKSLTVDPIKSGFDEYELKMGAIQTIMSGSGASLKEVNKYLAELNTYSDKTIYSFADMTQNIGKFTNAGVSLKDSVAAIKGVANVAAVSGANAEEASRAMYNFSQALSKGSVALIDWKSIELANMGTVEFKTQLLDAAVAAGTLKKDIHGAYTTIKGTPISATKGFNDSLQEEWLTTKVLTKTLGDYSNEQTKIGKKAYAAAQDVKTLSQMYDTLKEAAGSGWATTFELLFGNLTEAKGRWTALNNVIGGWIQNGAKARNEMISQWKAAGGLEIAVQAIKNAFAAVMAIVKPIKEAFREIFPPATTKNLIDLTTTIRDFFANIKMGAESADRLRRIFAGVFAIFDIGKQILMGILSVFKDLVTSVNEGNGGFMEIAARIGDFLVKVDQAVKSGGKLANFFDNLGTILQRIVGFVSVVGDALMAIFDDKNAAITATGDALGRIGDRLNPLKGLLDTLVAAWGRFLDVLAYVSPALSDLLQKISKLFSGIGPAISNAIANGNYSAMLDTINTVIFGAIALLFKKFMKDGIKIDAGGGFLGKIGGAFDALTGNLKAMQTQIKAKALLEIAGAVALLTVSVVALSMIDSKKLAVALGGLAGVFTELMLAMAVLGKIAGGAGFIKIPLISASLILLSTAILILTGAVKILSTISWGDMVKGLLGLAGMLTIIITAMNLIPTQMMFSAAAAMMGIGVAVNLLAVAMKIFATMSWEEIGKGLTGVAGSLTAIAIAMQMMPKGMVLQAGALILIGTALTILAGAVSIFGTMEWGTIGKGLVGIGGALVVIAGAMALMPGPMLILTAAGLVLVGLALNEVAAAMKIMGSMSWDEIGRGLVTLAGSLVILAAGLYLMTGTLAGSASLLVAAGALAVLAPVLNILGGLSWEEIGKGLITIAGAFAVIGIAGLLLSPIIPAILGLGAAVALLGVGLALAGVGVLAFATAITLLVAAGSLGIAALTAIMATVIGIIPTVMKALEVALVAFAGAIITAAPAIIGAIVVVLVSLMDAIIRLTPKIVKTLGVLLDALIVLLVSYIPKLVVAGVQIVTGILEGLTRELPKLLTAGANLIIAFVKGIGAQSLRITKAAGETLITFMEGLTTWINTNSKRIGKAGGDLAGAIIKGIVEGIGAGVRSVVSAVGDLASNVIQSAKDFFHINSPSKDFIEIGGGLAEGTAVGVDKNAKMVDKPIENLAKRAINGMKDSLSGMSDILSAELDMTPTVAPVLDLDSFRKDAAGMNDILTPKAVVPTASAQTAATISAVTAAQALAASDQQLAATGTMVEFTQNNYSPESLSNAEIYRQTKNQLSVIKGGLPG